MYVELSGYYFIIEKETNKVLYYALDIPIPQNNIYYIQTQEINIIKNNNVILYSPEVLSGSLLQEANWQILVQQAQELIHKYQNQWGNCIVIYKYTPEEYTECTNYYNSLQQVINRELDVIPATPSFFNT